MRFLFDSCVGRTAAERLREAGHDVVRIQELGDDPGDARVLQIAWEQDRILVTADKDFGELAVVFGAKHKGIVRFSGVAATQHANTLLNVLSAHGGALLHAALITIEPHRIRIRASE